MVIASTTVWLLECCCLAFAFYAQVVAFLLERGADVEAKDSTLVTPMHCAAAGGSVDCCKLLFTKGAVVSARDDKVLLCLLILLHNNCVFSFDSLIGTGGAVLSR
jgi:ankyrin repeat protein